MDKLIVGAVIVWGAFWLLTVLFRVLSELVVALRLHWDRSRPVIERVGYAVSRPTAGLAVILADYRLMTLDMASTIGVIALMLAASDSLAVIGSFDGFA